MCLLMIQTGSQLIRLCKEGCRDAKECDRYCKSLGWYEGVCLKKNTLCCCKDNYPPLFSHSY